MITLEQSKELDKRGIKIESELNYRKREDWDKNYIRNNIKQKDLIEFKQIWLPAPNSEELIEFITKKVGLGIDWAGDRVEITTWDKSTLRNYTFEDSENLLEGLYQTIIYLDSNGLINKD